MKPPTTHRYAVIEPSDNRADNHEGVAPPSVKSIDCLQKNPPWRIVTLLPRLLAQHAAEMVRTGRLRRFVCSLRGFYALRYWQGHLKLARVMAHPGLIELVRCRPRTLFKYLHRSYLAVGLDNACRLEILTHHYSCLIRSFPAPFLRALMTEGLVVWQQLGSPLTVGITLSFPQHDFEGELMLKFTAGDTMIYSVTVTLAGGGLIGPNGHNMLLITCLQGGARQLPLIRQATHACANTPPAYLLLAAVEGIAAALGVERVIAVGNARQLAKSRDAAAETVFDYDHFWTCLGGVPTNDGFYVFPAQLPEKPLTAFPSRHRSREVRKRRLKRSVAVAVTHCLHRVATGTSAPPPRF
jgi:uncharacterized protein VirK/YbjX